MEDMMMMMQMWFEATTKVTLWFKEWKISAPAWYAVSCIGLFGLCLVQEALARYRVAFMRRTNISSFQPLRSVDDEAQTASAGSSSPSSWNTSGGQMLMRATTSLLYGVNIATSYLLMLAVMTFNVGYFVVICAGLAVGHFIFYPAASGSSNDSSEACCPQPG